MRIYGVSEIYIVKMFVSLLVLLLLNLAALANGTFKQREVMEASRQIEQGTNVEKSLRSEQQFPTTLSKAQLKEMERSALAESRARQQRNLQAGKSGKKILL